MVKRDEMSIEELIENIQSMEQEMRTRIMELREICSKLTSEPDRPV